MKRYGQLWEQVVCWENLIRAARKAQRGKRSRVAVQAFNFGQERERLRIQRQLQDGTYRQVLWLMDSIVDRSNEQERAVSWFDGDDLLTPLARKRGIPIGNLTSQWFANWTLSDLDHFVTSHLRLGAYVRYCDDFVVLHDDKVLLNGALEQVQERLAVCRLRIHERRSFVRPTRAGVTFVGYRMWPTHRIIRKENIRGFRRRVRWMRSAYACGIINWEDVKHRLASWIGHARQADSGRLLSRLSREWTFSRGRAKRVSGSPGRLVEQQRQQPALCEPQQQQPRQPEQQQRVPVAPALSVARGNQAGNRAIHGSPEGGFESPGSVPEPVQTCFRQAGRIHVGGPGGSGRSRTERPIRSVLKGLYCSSPLARSLRRLRRCA